MRGDGNDATHTSARSAPDGRFISYAQNFEDVMLHRALKNVQSGFYIDVGAHDPVSDSVTLAFYQRGWCGMNLDPVPSMIEGFYSQRPRDINLMVAVSDTDGEIEMNEIVGTGLSTADKAVASTHNNAGRDVRKRVVPCRTLASLCAEHVRGDIHFLKIDVEGFEEAVLRGMDFSAHRPWIVVVEATLPLTQETNHQSWEHLITNSGYVFVYFDGLNRFYIAQERRADLAHHFNHPPCAFDGFVLSKETALSETVAELKESNAQHTAALESKHLEAVSKKSEIARLRDELDALKKKTRQLEDTLRHHQSNPLRALKLWWRRKR
jgi:FkbM family methyltransferase